MSKVQDWDLNIYFPEEWNEEADDYISADTIRINPVLWVMEDGVSNVTYSNKVIQTTFAETRYIRSQYPEIDFGYDWTDSLTNFLNIAPPRLHSLLATLPEPMDMTEKMVIDLVG
ncbi:hypothetical protein UFOVP222_116 [uncultured Caudovirales phage]|uniref:Uncharacterized protein n=1 Tax=uncultured Caudovirales phage TaxID=2100421 RepID=A0A6J7WX89_9CAUD|nr:hypothetical protein UFOVP108_111 [uncultured Caudovirales phage]CAB5219703.1 hypothetical protein UFOVP222_116 [uncultured Caudovirales phage]